MAISITNLVRTLGLRTTCDFKRKKRRSNRFQGIESFESRALLAATVADTSFQSTGSIAGGTSSLTVTFSESVIFADQFQNYELRSAGSDGIIGTADDTQIALQPSGIQYNPGSRTTTIGNLSLSENAYRLTVRDHIIDTTGQFLDGDNNSVRGGNYVGEFIVGNPVKTVSTSATTEVPGLTNVVSVAAGVGHYLALRSDGIVWAWGTNSFGQLGNGTTSASSTPIQVPGLSNVASIAAGSDESFAIMNDGTARIWGRNIQGLNNGSGVVSSWTSPTVITGLSNVQQISTLPTDVNSADNHVLVLLKDGTVKGWGNTQLGKLGSLTGTISTPTTIPGLSGVTAVAAGDHHSLALRSDGSVLAFGYSPQGELGLGTGVTVSTTPALIGGLTGITSIAAGASHSLAVRSDATLYGWGTNSVRQLGPSPLSTGNFYSPVTIPSSAGIGIAVAGYQNSTELLANGAVYRIGSSTSQSIVSGLNSVKSLASGAYTAVVLRAPTSQTVNVEFATATSSGSEGSTASPKLLVKGTVATPQTIELIKIGGSADSSDFLLGAISIPAGSYDGTIGTAIDIPIPLLADSIAENDETVTLALVHSTTELSIGDTNASSSTQATHTLTIPGQIPPTVVGTTPSFATSGTLVAGTTSLVVNFSQAVEDVGLDGGNFDLRSEGPDGLLGTADDIVVALTVTNGNTFGQLDFDPLPAGIYRLSVRDSITDTTGIALDGDVNGAAGGDWVHDFVVNTLQVELDRSFGNGGLVTSAIGPSNDVVRGVAVQADGKILVAGNSTSGSGNDDFALARYNVDGAFDSTFGNAGKVATAIGALNDYANALTVQSDGRIIVVGRSSNGTNDDFAVARYLPNGQLDSSFGNNGRLTTAVGVSDERAFSVAVQSDGKIIVAGYTRVGSTDDFAIVRYLPSGSLDTSFGTAGKVTTAIGTGHDGIHGMVVQSDGKILVAGYAHNGSNYDFALARYLSNGTLDTAFGSGGKRTTNFGTGDDIVYGLAVQSDGRILVAGNTQNGTNLDFALARYVPNGNLDTTFGSNGGVTTDFGFADETAYGVAIQSNGKILAAGRSFNGSNDDFAISRYNADGSLDSTFDGDGKLTQAIGASTDGATGLAIQSDGKIVAAGYSSNGANHDFALARYAATGTYDRISTNGAIFDVDQSGIGSGQLVHGTDGAFDGMNRLQVAGVDFAPLSTPLPVRSDNDRTLATSSVTTAGLVIQREITVPNAGAEDFARTLDVFTNLTGSDITVPVRLLGNLGSDAGTTVFATSDGDLIVEPTDLWFGTDDGDGTGTPAIIQLLHGPSGLQPTVVNVIGDNVEWSYDLTVPAGETRRLAHFSVLGATRTEAITAANALVTAGGFGGEAAAFLTTAELDSLANFQFNTAPVADAGGPYSGLEGGSVSLNATASSDQESANALLTFEWDLDYDGVAFDVNTTGEQPSVSFSDNFSARTIALRVTDPFGASDIATASLAVNNVAPTLTISGATSVNEGGVYTLNLATSDPGDDTISAWSINWGDGSTPEIVPGNTTSVVHIYGDGTRKFTILATATDEDGTYSAKASGQNAQASLDPAFGNSGEVIQNLDGFTADYVRGISVIQPDGKVIVVGQVQGGTTRIGLARYHSNGSLDTTFGDNGTTLTEFGTYAYPESLVLDDSGHILVGGSFGLARYDSSGLIDLSFGNGGRITSFSNIRKLILDGNGNILASDGNRLARFQPNGAFDLSFAQNGVTNFLTYFTDMTIANDGKIVTAENRYNGNQANQYDIIMRRYHANGQVDNTFGQSGVFMFDNVGQADYVRSVAIQHGQILVSGYTSQLQPLVNNPNSFQTLNQSVLLFRLTSDGQSLDNSFGSSGVVSYRYNAAQGNNYDYTYGLAVDASNRIVVSGSYGLYRFSPSGSPDTNFITNGINARIVYPYNGGGIAFDVNGLIYLGGYVNVSGVEGSNFGVQRFLDSGARDNSFDLDSYVQTGFSGPLADYLRQVSVQQADGKIMVAGYTSGGSTEMLLARYLPNGQPDISFGNGGITRTGIGGSVAAAAVAADGTIYLSDGSYIYRYKADGTRDTTSPSNGFGTSGQRYAEGVYVRSLRIDASGRLLAGGYRGQLNAGHYSNDIAVVRFSATGILDTSYGVNGIASLDLSSTATIRGEQFPYAFEIDSLGRMIASGYTQSYDTTTSQWSSAQALIARFTGQGQVDSTFSGSGYLVTVGADGSNFPQSLAVDSLDRIVVGFNSAVHRYAVDGSLDATFSDDGMATTNNNSIQAVKVDGVGRVVAGGNSFLFRFRDDGTPDTSFGPAGRVTISNRTASSIAFDSSNQVIVAGNTASTGPTGIDYWLARFITDGLSVTVNNVAPQNLVITGPATANEGSSVTLSASATDPAGANDPLTYSWNITRNGSAYLQISGESITFSAPDNGSYTATVTVTDGDGGTAIQSRTVVVANVIPTAVLSGGVAVTYGDSLTVSFSDQTDPSSVDTAAGFHYAYSLSGDFSGVSFTAGSSTSESCSWPLLNAGTYTAYARIIDKDNGYSEYTTSFVVEKANAVITVTPYNVTYDGVSHTASGSAIGVLGETLAGLNFSGTTHANAGTYDDNVSFTDVTGNYNDVATIALTNSIARANAVVTVSGYAGTYDATAHGATGSFEGVAGDLGANGASLNLGDSYINAPGGLAWWYFDGGQNYNSQNGVVSIDIAKADAVVTVIGYSGIYDAALHGATGAFEGVAGDLGANGASLNLGDSYINAPGGLAWWYFDGGQNYNSQNGVVSIDIAKADAVVTVDGYSGIYDAALHGATGAFEGVAGDLGANGASLNLGDSYINAPGGLAWWYFDGGQNYNSQNGVVSIDIAKADAVVTVNGYSGIYDAAFHGATGSFEGVAGDLAAAGASLDLGASFTNAPGGTATWTFTGGQNYNSQSGTVEIVILNIIPELNSLTSSAGIVDDASSDGSVSVSGTFLDLGPDTHLVIVDWGDGTVESVAVNEDTRTFHGLHEYATGGLYTIRVKVSDNFGAESKWRAVDAFVEGVGVVNGTLYIIGTNGRDDVKLKVNENKDQLTVDAKFAHGRPGDGCRESDSGSDRIRMTLKASEINRVVAFLRDGDDKFDGGGDSGSDECHDGGIQIRQLIFGGRGDDDLRGGQWNDALFGEAGDDDISGGGGADILVGGYGKDKIDGDRGRDLLIGGIVDNNFADSSILNDIDSAMIEWARGDLADVFSFLGPIIDDSRKDSLFRDRDDEIFAGAGDSIKR